jgi:hypothetical protein
MTTTEIMILDRVLIYLSYEQLEDLATVLENRIQNICSEFILEDNERKELKEMHKSYSDFLNRVNLLINS